MPKCDVDFRLVLADGKYTYIYYKDGASKCLRYNQEWRDTTGDNLIHALAHELNKAMNTMAHTAEVMRGSAARITDAGHSLVDSIRAAQVNAGEQAVLDNLEAMGLAKKIVGKE